MNFLFPLGLLALLTLPVILILHLLRERRRRVVVPSLLLWRLLPPQQEAQRRKRLPLTLLLLLHLLVAALLGLALAHPQWQFGFFHEAHHVVVVLDTSTSMAAPAADNSGTRLDAARSRARWLISGMEPEETVTLIATNPRPHLVATGGPEEAARLLVALAGLQANGTGSEVAAALTLAEAALQGRSGARVVVLTDAALPNTQLEKLTTRPNTLPLEWVAVGGPRDNRAIVSLAARQRGTAGLVQIYGRAVNYGQAPLQTVLRLFGDDQLLDTRAVTMQAGGEVELTWLVPRGISLLRAELDGADTLPADDTATISLAPTRPVQALLVSDLPASLERALRAVPGLTLTTLAPNLYPGAAEAATADLTIFDSFLPPAWPEGGVLVVNPPPASALLTVSATTHEPAPDQTALQVEASSAALLQGVSLNSVAFGPTRTVTPPDWAVALLTRGAQPLMLRGRVGQSEVALWAFDLAQGNLRTRLAFPLLVARTVRDLTPAPLPASALLGDEPQIVPDPRATRVQVTAPNGSVQMLAVTPGERLPLSLEQPGVYTLSEQTEGRTLATGTLAVNAGAPFESDLTPHTLPRNVPPSSSSSTEAAAASPLWPWLTVAALALLLFEWAYVHGRRRTPTEV